ncbi:MAG: CoA transferase [Deltaproteobacteria bacterium]|nr:CoA transferase [Deltaproteobacteria bacterium]
MQSKALEGVKILDFTWIAAGPLTTIYLAKCGATVVKVESMAKPDGVRTSPPYIKGKAGLSRSMQFSNDNANKLSIAINLKHPKGIEIAGRLVAWADIVAENMRPGAMEKLGLGYEDLKKINPSIIMFRSSFAGQHGPQSRLSVTGTELQGLCGFTILTGYPDRDPIPPWGAYTDLTVPALSVGMLAGALDYKRKTGKGQCLDLAQFEASLHYLSPAILDYFANHRSQTRNGNKCDYAAPHGVFRCKGDDRWCTIAVFTDEEWNAFIMAIGNPPWTSDPKFAGLVERKKNEEELNRHIEEWTMNMSAEEVMNLLQGHGISSGVVETAADLLRDPQVKTRRFLQKLDIGEGETLSHQGLGFQLSKTPYETSTPGPGLGEHTEQVCREILEMPDDEFIELFTSGVFE